MYSKHRLTGICCNWTYLTCIITRKLTYTCTACIRAGVLACIWACRWASGGAGFSTCIFTWACIHTCIPARIWACRCQCIPMYGIITAVYSNVIIQGAPMFCCIGKFIHCCRQEVHFVTHLFHP